MNEIENLKKRVAELESVIRRLSLLDRYAFEKLIQILDGRNIIVGTTTGTKIGTAVTQKIGFFGATPVVAQAGAAGTADATYSANEVTMINNMYTAMRNYGLLVG